MTFTTPTSRPEPHLCDICFEPTRNRKRDPHGFLLCNDCRSQFAYYAHMTPEERRREDQMIAEYVAAHETDAS